jgi:hypothetical protein
MTAEPLPALSRSNLKKSSLSSFSYYVVFFKACCREAKSPRDFLRSPSEKLILFSFKLKRTCRYNYSAYSTSDKRFSPSALIYSIKISIEVNSA